MKVLYVSKAMVVAAYRAKLRALAAHCDVELLVPNRWGAFAYEETDAGDVVTRRTRALLHGHNHLHLYRDADRLLRESAPQLVHIDEEPYSAVTWQLVRASRVARVPCVFFAWQNLSKRIPPPFGAMRGYVFRHAQGAIAGTSQAAAVLRTAGCALPYAVIPQMGVDTERFAPDMAARARVRERFGIRPETLAVGFAGRLVPEKGVHVLIEALASLPGTHLLVYGTGPERERLERRAARALPGRATFAGHVASTAMPDALRALDLLVLPSLRTSGWVEQFGRVLIEAMACGVPVIGSATGEIPHVIGDAGVIVPEGDAHALRGALDTLASRELRCALSGRARRRVLENYTHERIAADTAAFYRRVTAA